MRALQGLLGAALFGSAACTPFNEQVRLQFPMGTREAVESLVITAIDPIISDENLERPRFVTCEELGVFRPTQQLEAGADAPSDPAVLGQRRFPFPSDDLEIRFSSPGQTRNPWGVVAILVEARARALEFQDTLRTYTEEEVTVLQGCYCVRTQPGASADGPLDDRVRDACPFIGEQLDQAQREVAMAPVVPPEFRLEPCGTSEAAVEVGGSIVSGPQACLRVDTCLDVPLGQPCFDCVGACPELQDRSGGVVEYRVLNPESGIEPLRQRVVTVASGRVQPELLASDCIDGSLVQATIFGSVSQTHAFEVSCLDPSDAWELASSRLVEPEDQLVSLKALDVLDPAGGRGPVLVTQAQPPDPGENGESNETIVTTWEFMNSPAGGRLEPLDSWRQAGTYAVGIQAVPAGTLASDPALVTALALPEGSEQTTDERNVFFRMDSWDGSRFTRTATISSECARCDCGSFEACSEEEGALCRVPGARPGERCVQGRCQDGSCVCPMVAGRDERVAMAVGDVDADGIADLLAYGNADTSYTTYFSAGAASQPYSASRCACGRFRPESGRFALGDLGNGELTNGQSGADLVVANSQGTFLRYASLASQSPSSGPILGCGQTVPVGTGFDVRAVKMAPFRCPVNTSCSALTDLVVVGRVIGPDPPTQIRVIFGADEDLSGDQSLFDRPEQTAFYLPQGNSPPDPVAIETGDVNGDGWLDFAILFRLRRQVRFWMGNGARGFTESRERLELSPDDDPDCSPLVDLVVRDLDQDGTDEVAVICNPNDVNSQLRVYRRDP